MTSQYIIICRKCEGSGEGSDEHAVLTGEGPKPCTDCLGSGRQIETTVTFETECSRCNGSGIKTTYDYEYSPFTPAAVDVIEVQAKARAFECEHPVELYDVPSKV